MAKFFSKIVDSTLDAVKKVNTWLSDVFTRFSRRKITVHTEVKGVEKVEETKRKLESLPKTKTVKVKVGKNGDLSGLSGPEASKAIPAKPEVPRLPTPPVGPWSKMKGIFRPKNPAGISNNTISKLFCRHWLLCVSSWIVRELVARGIKCRLIWKIKSFVSLFVSTRTKLSIFIMKQN